MTTDTTDPPGTKRLPLKWAKYLYDLPETGMGYQTVDIVLNNGEVVKDVAIIQCEIIGEVRDRDRVPFDPKDIAEVQLTHRKWEWRTQ